MKTRLRASRPTGIRALRWMPWSCFAFVLTAVGCGTPSATDAASDGSSDGANDNGSESESESETGSSGMGWTEAYRSTVGHGGLWAVYGHSEQEVVAVGGQVEAGGSVATIVVRDAQGVWARETAPAELGALNWVSGVGAQAYVVVGRQGTIAIRDADGVYEVLDSGTEALLWGVWGASEDELIAVGTDDGMPVFLQRAGPVFETVDYPGTALMANALFKVWGRAADDITVVGDAGWLLTYDGDSWSETDSQGAGDLISVWGDAAHTVAVGGRSNARVVHRADGGDWQDIQLLEPGLSGVFVGTDGFATAVGDQGTILHFAVADLADADADVFTKEESPTPLLLHGVFGFPSGLRIAVGGNLAGAPPYVGIVLEATD